MFEELDYRTHLWYNRFILKNQKIPNSALKKEAVYIDKFSKVLANLSIINCIMIISFNIKLNIKTGNSKTRVTESVSYSYGLNTLTKYSVRLMFVIYIAVALLLGSISPLSSMMPINITEDVRASEKSLIYSTEIQKREKKLKPEKEDKFITLQEKYKNLAGYYCYPNVEPHLDDIDKVLKTKGLDNDALFIQAMFFIGQYESHWNTGSLSGSSVGSEHPTGIFQFLPSTFRTVSRGNIYDATDQIYAFVTMVERGRVDEFATLFLPGLSQEAKSYVMNYR